MRIFVAAEGLIVKVRRGNFPSALSRESEFLNKDKKSSGWSGDRVRKT